MSNVFVLDTYKKPLDPIHPGYARKLLTQGKAAVYRRYPFTIIFKKEAQEPVTQPLRLKVDLAPRRRDLPLSMMHQGKWYGRRNSRIEGRPSRKPSMIAALFVEAGAN
jgi:hypothetical protein